MTPIFLTDHAEIREWLAKNCGISGEVTIDSDGQVSVTGSVFVNYQAKPTRPHFDVQFARVDGLFDCSECSFTSLHGAPHYVGIDFNCNACSNLTSLDGAPLFVGGDFTCTDCASLVSLEGAPAHVKGSFDCYDCPKLRTLAGAPKIVGDCFYCSHCSNLDEHALAGLGQVKGHLGFNRLVKPTAAAVRNLFRHQTKLETLQKTKWISIVNDYHESGDLLTAIAQFEKYFKEPFALRYTPEAVPEITP